MPPSIASFYVALAVWGLLIARGRSRPTQWPLIAAFGLVLLLFLNARYLIEGAPAGIAYFISLYDFFDNLGLDPGAAPAAMATCSENACSLWSETYLLHQSWGVAFFDRFMNAPAMRTNALYVHLFCNSVVFILMHLQVLQAGQPGSKTSHRWLGRTSLGFLTLGTAAALYLAGEHDAVSAYGGLWAEWGFYSMSLCVYGAALMGWGNARKGDWEQHRIWMLRFIGAMYGAFWLFRIFLVVSGPLLREWEGLSLLFSIWVSAPAGLLAADWLRRRWDAKLIKQLDSPAGQGV